MSERKRVNKKLIKEWQEELGLEETDKIEAAEPPKIPKDTIIKGLIIGIASSLIATLIWTLCSAWAGM